MDARISHEAENNKPELQDLQKKSPWSGLKKARLPYLAEFAIVFALFVVRFLYYGFKYYPQLNDYIRFHNYTEFYSLHASSLWEYVTDGLGLFISHPLTAIGDIYIISAFFSSLILVVIALGAMYAASAVIFRYIFNRLIGTGYFFTLIFCLTPLSLDGLYWLSASSRIIPALFFTALASLFMLKVTEQGRIRYAILFALTQLLSMCYCEQVAMLSVVITVLIAVKKRNKYSVTALLVPANLLLRSLYSQIARMLWGGGVLANTSEVTLPFATKDYFTTVFPSVSGNLLEAAGSFMPLTFLGALWQSITAMVSDIAIVYLLVIVLLCLIAGYLLLRFAKHEPTSKSSILSSLLFSVLLMLAPILPLYFIDVYADVGIHSLVPSLCGAALLLDMLFRLLLGKKRRAAAIVISALALVSCISSVSELQDYRLTFEHDNEVAFRIIEAVEELAQKEELSEDTEIAVLNIGATILPDQSFASHTHIASTTAEKWSLTALLRCLSDNGAFPTVTAMPVDKNGFFYYEEHGKSYRVENYDYVFVATEDELIRVTPARGYIEDDFVPKNDGTPTPNYDSYLLYTDDIIRIARVTEYSHYGMFEFY